MERGQWPLQIRQSVVTVALNLLRVMFGLMGEGATYDPSGVLGEVRQAQVAAVA